MQVIRNPKDGVDSCLEILSAVRRSLETNEGSIAEELKVRVDESVSKLTEARGVAERLRASQERARARR